MFFLPSHKLNLLLPVSKLLSTTSTHSTLGFPLKKDIWANSTFTDISNIETGRGRERENTNWHIGFSWKSAGQGGHSLLPCSGHWFQSTDTCETLDHSIKLWNIHTQHCDILENIYTSQGFRCFQRSYWVWIYDFIDGRENCYDKEVANPRPDRPNPTTILLMVAS